MKKPFALFLATLIFITSCKPLKNSIILADTKAPVIRTDITYSYSDDQIGHADNNLKKGWAKRNDVQVISLKLINNSEQAIHGSQLGFYADGERLELVDNLLACEKLRSKKFPTAVYVVPIFIVGYIIYAGALALISGDDGDSSLPDVTLPEKTDEAKDPLYKANELQKGLYHFNIAKQVIYPGEQISGFIPLKSDKPIKELDIKVHQFDYQVVGLQ